MSKTKQQLEDELEFVKELEKHRKESDDKYAVKLVERVLWSILATGFLALVGFFVSQVLQK